MKENQLSNGEIARYCKGLAWLLHSGISLGDGLFFLAEEEPGERGQMLKRMGQEMDTGMQLSAVMEKGGQFPAYAVGMVKTGEYTGHLEEALMALSVYYEGQERMERRVRSALTYPFLLLILMLVVVGVLLIRVLPVFDQVYASLGSGLTGFSRGLLMLGQFLKAAMPVLCAALAAVVVVVLPGLYFGTFRQRIRSGFKKYLGDRGAFRKVNNAHFAQALALGMRSGLNAEEAVEIAQNLLKDVPSAAARCKECSALLAQHTALAESLKKTGLLSAADSRLLELGIRSGSGEIVMEDIAARMSEEAAEDLEQSAARIEPAMVLTASVLVGMILLAVMLPLMDIMSAIG